MAGGCPSGDGSNASPVIGAVPSTGNAGMVYEKGSENVSASRRLPGGGRGSADGRQGRRGWRRRLGPDTGLVRPIQDCSRAGHRDRDDDDRRRERRSIHEDVPPRGDRAPLSSSIDVVHDRVEQPIRHPGRTLVEERGNELIGVGIALGRHADRSSGASATRESASRAAHSPTPRSAAWTSRSPRGSRVARPLRTTSSRRSDEAQGRRAARARASGSPAPADRDAGPSGCHPSWMPPRARSARSPHGGVGRVWPRCSRCARAADRASSRTDPGREALGAAATR